MPIVQFTRFKTDKAKDGPDCQAGEEGLLKTRCRISSAVPFPHWPVGRRVAG
jgi:hypothetical protein